MAGDLTIVAADVRLSSPHAPIRQTLKAGAVLTAGEAVYESSTGVLLESVTDAGGLSAIFDGIVVVSAAIGDPVTVFQQGSVIYIGAHGLDIGAFIYPSATAGKLSDTLISTGEQPIAKAVSATEIVVVRMDLPQIDNS
jgi:hypothetical protein